ncbi:YibE/F family protein [Vallitalea maricola]|uniref:YibE/F family protein n=1 Tax=Vallitalea maricola TaxID=3074433 RepID=UPI0033655064
MFWLRNGLSLSYIIGIGINLEIIRALIGSIGVVISIPITMYISVILLKERRIGVN